MATPTNVKLVSVTPDAEQTMAYIARVSNPANQDNEKYAGLLKYCIKHNHWSVFEQSTMTLEIETTRAYRFKFCATAHLHIKSFRNGMQTLLYLVIRSLCLNCVVRMRRIVRTVLMIWIPLRFRF